jgi:excisionase family DNA binding protein
MPSGGCVALPTLYTPEEVAKKLRVSRRAVYEWLKSGKLNGLKAGQYWRVTEEDMTQFLKRHLHNIDGTRLSEDRSKHLVEPKFS